MIVEQLNAEITWAHVGQYHPYGDTVRVAEIACVEPLSEETILKLCNNDCRLPKSEWEKHYYDISMYFRGYYTIEKTDYGYKYTSVDPYTD